MTMAAIAPYWLVSSGGTVMPNISKKSLMGLNVGVSRLNQIRATATAGTTKGMTNMPRMNRHLGIIFSSPTAINVPRVTWKITPSTLNRSMTLMEAMKRLLLNSLMKL